MENTTNDVEVNKLNEVLRLMNNCRNKISALFDLFESCILSARGNVNKMSSLYYEMMGLRDGLEASGKTSGVKAKADAIKNEFDEERDMYSTSLDEPEKHRNQYKSEVSACCKFYKSISSNANESIEKGYKMQVKIIRKILDKINELIVKYNADHDKVVGLTLQFEDLYNQIVASCKANKKLVLTA